MLLIQARIHQMKFNGQIATKTNIIFWFRERLYSMEWTVSIRIRAGSVRNSQTTKKLNTIMKVRNKSLIWWLHLTLFRSRLSKDHDVRMAGYRNDCQCNFWLWFLSDREPFSNTSRILYKLYYINYYLKLHWWLYSILVLQFSAVSSIPSFALLRDSGNYTIRINKI